MGTREVTELLRIYDGNGPQLLGLLAGQLQVLKAQAQTLLGVGGLAISVTGFAGHNMVAAGLLPTLCMVSGLSVIFLAMLATLRAIVRIAWVSAELEPDLSRTVARVIERRDEQQRSLARAGAAVMVGLGFYVVAVILAALERGQWSPP